MGWAKTLERSLFNMVLAKLTDKIERRVVFSVLSQPRGGSPILGTCSNSTTTASTQRSCSSRWLSTGTSRGAASPASLTPLASTWSVAARGHLVSSPAHPHTLTPSHHHTLTPSHTHTHICSHTHTLVRFSLVIHFSLGEFLCL